MSEDLQIEHDYYDDLVRVKEENKRLRAKIKAIEVNRSLRGYDGLQDKADKLAEAAEKAFLVLARWENRYLREQKPDPLGPIVSATMILNEALAEYRGNDD
jgi:hypothetical protein